MKIQEIQKILTHLIKTVADFRQSINLKLLIKILRKKRIKDKWNKID